MEVFSLNVGQVNDPILKERAFETPIVVTKAHLRAIKNKCVAILDPYSADGTTILYNPNKASVIGLEGRALKSPREVLQIIGTDYIRERIFSGWHLNAAFSTATLDKIIRLHGRNAVLCVTDIRFVNEYEFLKEKFGNDFTCYYITRPEAEKQLNKATHPSELETRKIRDLLGDSVIVNDGSMDELEEKLSKLELSTKEEKLGKGSRFGFVTKDGAKRATGNTNK